MMAEFNRCANCGRRWQEDSMEVCEVCADFLCPSCEADPGHCGSDTCAAVAAGQRSMFEAAGLDVSGYQG